MTARKNFIADKLRKPDVFLDKFDSLLPQILERRGHNRMQHHDSVSGEKLPASLEECLVPCIPEMFKRADADDPVDRFGKLLPSL